MRLTRYSFNRVDELLKGYLPTEDSPKESCTGREGCLTTFIVAAELTHQR